MCSSVSFRGGSKERRLMICWSYSFGGGSKMERRLVMCSSYRFRGGSKWTEGHSMVSGATVFVMEIV